MPVIALVNGAAVGGGCELAIACDYRIVSSSAKAGFIQGTLAITTGWGGATLLFEKDGKHDRVFRLLSEAEVHTADQLLEAGWATEIYEGNAGRGLSVSLLRCPYIIRLSIERIRLSPFGNGRLISCVIVCLRKRVNVPFFGE